LTIAAVIGMALPYPHELKVALFAIWGSFFMSALSQIVVGVHQRHFTMHLVAIGEVVGRLTLLAGVLLAIARGWGLVPIVTIVSVGSAIHFLVIALTARRFAALQWNWDPVFWKELLRRSWPVGLSIVFNLVYFKADTLILSIMRPSFAEVGIYGAAYRVLEILITIPFMYTGVLLPLLAQALASKDLVRFRSLYRNSLVAMAILAAPLLAGVAVLGRQMMTLVAGKDFSTSGDVLKILMIAAAIIFLGTVTSHAIIALNIQRAMLPIYIIVALATLAGYVILIPRYGMWAAAWLTVASEACVALGSALLSLRRSGTRLAAAPYVKTALAALLMALTISPLKDAWLPIPILTGAAIYGALIVMFDVVPREILLNLFTFRKGTGTIPPI
ncbi:MAG: oligosaccharide flippase family protein, partial [Patescibacteria group bacterium]